MDKTNQEPHNIWTLTKHTAKSLNKMAGKVDEAIYGTTVQPTVVEKPKSFSQSHPFLMTIGAIVIVLLVVVTIIFYSDSNKNDGGTPSGLKWWNWWI